MIFFEWMEKKFLNGINMILEMPDLKLVDIYHVFFIPQKKKIYTTFLKYISLLRVGLFFVTLFLVIFIVYLFEWSI